MRTWMLLWPSLHLLIPSLSTLPLSCVFWGCCMHTPRLTRVPRPCYLLCCCSLHGIRQDMEELQLSLNRSVGLTGDEQADEERWLTEVTAPRPRCTLCTCCRMGDSHSFPLCLRAQLKKWYGQGVSRGAGTAEMRSRHAWTTGQKYWEPVPDPETAALREEEERGPLRSRGRGGQRGGRR